MASRLVIGLFHSSGIAEDAVHRLITEGVSPRDVAHRVLKEVGPTPPILDPELAALEVDPLVLGDARESFAQYIRNGETAVFVRAISDEQVEFATDVLELYLPITIEVVALPERPASPSP
ncbi:MAG: hypothetical protein WA633_11010 [Stellaceae bacterium]